MLEQNKFDAVITSRVRLARNIDGYPFVPNMSESDLLDMNKKIKAAILNTNTPFAKSLKFINMNDVPELEAFSMVERHIISPDFAQNRKNKAIIISDDESVCVMIGEEDHIRIQVLKSGFELEAAYDIAERLDCLLAASLPIAFDSRLGYLTECPTNLGTGLRASLMLHLPMLENSGEISGITDAVRQLGFTVRGIYGEGTKSSAALYQLSNQITLGISEKDAINNLKAIAEQIIEKELSLRLGADKLQLEDTVFRSLALLKSSRIITTREAMQYLSVIKLGADMGIIDIEKTLPMKTLIEIQPNMLMKKIGISDAKIRDAERAKLLREQL